MKPHSIVFETEYYTVVAVAKGFEIYRKGNTASTRCAVIGYSGEKGLQKAKEEIHRRESQQ